MEQDNDYGLLSAEEYNPMGDWIVLMLLMLAFGFGSHDQTEE